MALSGIFTDGSQNTALLYNPYKFAYHIAGTVSVTGSQWNLVKMDTKDFDTSTNYSVSTGLFTAPVAGFYQFSALCIQSLADTQLSAIGLYKNVSSGTPTIGGTQIADGGATAGALGISVLLQLAANDTIGVAWYNGGATGNLTATAPIQNYFHGSLVSLT